ncbi:hypothetical protein RFI_35004, partial [Reticulomyxa filosa]
QAGIFFNFDCIQTFLWKWMRCDPHFCPSLHMLQADLCRALFAWIFFEDQVKVKVKDRADETRIEEAVVDHVKQEKLVGNIFYHWSYNRRCEDLAHEMFDFVIDMPEMHLTRDFVTCSFFYSLNSNKQKVHEMVNKMINKQQVIVIVAKNIDELSKLNYQLPEYDVPFSMMINSNQYMKKRLIFGSYSVSFIPKKLYLIISQLMDLEIFTLYHFGR